MKKSALLVCTAGLAVSSAAFAQNNDAPVDIQGVIMKEVPQGGFGERVNQVVYALATTSAVYSVNPCGGETPATGFSGWRFPGAGARVGGDDIDFTPGPGANGGDGAGGALSITGAAFAVAQPAGSTNSTDITARIRLYDTFNGWNVGTFPGAAPLGTVYYDIAALTTPGFITFYAAPLNFNLGRAGGPTAIPVALNAGAADAYADVSVLVLNSTDTPHPDIYPYGRGCSLNHTIVGASDQRRWFDGGGAALLVNGLIEADELNPVSTAVNGRRSVYFQFLGDAPVAGTPVSEALPGCATGSIADGTTSDTDTIAVNGVKWYQVCVGQAVDDDTLRYLDIDTEGSVDDVDIALYDAAGALIANDGDSGSGNNAALSFGVGRRAGISGGLQFDGRDGDLLNLVDDVYYLAVGPTGSTFGPGGFAAANSTGLGASATINVRTNVNSGSNDPSVAPDVLTDLNDPIDFVLAAGVTTGTDDLHVSNTSLAVRWSTFTLANAVCTSAGSLDFDWTTNDDGPVVDGLAWLFDSNGDIVAFSDDTGGTNNPQFSFGSTTSRPPVAGNTLDFSGQDGTLNAGTYYIATALFDADVSDLSGVAAGSDRWHVRGTSGSSLNMQVILTHVAGTGSTCGATCDSIDFNNDTSLFDPQDIDAFLSVYSEGDCVPSTQTCNDIDFNNDSSVFDPCDIASFLTQYAEGPCTPCGG